MRGWRRYAGTVGYTARRAKQASPPRRHIETSLQIVLVEFFQRHVPQDKGIIFAISQGFSRLTRRKAALLKQLGVMAGVSDLAIVMFGGRTIWVEVKRPGIKSPVLGKIDRGRLSQSQKGFRDCLSALGHRFEVVDTPEAFTSLLKALRLVPESLPPPLFLPQLA